MPLERLLPLLVSVVALTVSILQAIRSQRETDRHATRESVQDLRAECDRMRDHLDNCERARTALYADNLYLMKRVLGLDTGRPLDGGAVIPKSP